MHCNLYSKNAVIEYFLFMEKTYGRELIDELRRLKHEPIKFNRDELLDRIGGYKARFETLQEAA